MKTLTQRGYLLAPLAIALVAVLLYWIAQARPGLAVTLGAIFCLAVGAAFVMARLEKAKGTVAAVAVRLPTPQAAAPRTTTAESAAAFRIVGARGQCTLGRRIGELVQVGDDGRCSPGLCSAAESTLRMAAKAADTPAGQQWCCPVYNHLLVFQRMT